MQLVFRWLGRNMVASPAEPFVPSWVPRALAPLAPRLPLNVEVVAASCDHLVAAPDFEEGLQT